MLFRSTWARSSLPQPVAAATYNANNQQLTFGGQTLTYDLNGNLTGDGTNTYTWTARNQLAMITGPVPASFVYDGSGRRMRKTINGTITDFLYDGANPIQEVSGAAATSLLTGLGIDEYFLRGDASGASALLADALGSAVALTDTAGAVQSQYTYEPFGATATTGAASANPFQYTGRENDGTGLYYYRARYYHPGLQRFISEDPAGYLGGSSNLYLYARNNPANLVDPSGLVDSGRVARGLIIAGGGAATIAAAAGVGLAVPPSAPIAITGAITGAGALSAGLTDAVMGVITPSGKQLPELPPISPVGLVALLASKGNVELANKIELLVDIGTLPKKVITLQRLAAAGGLSAEEIKIITELVKLDIDILRVGSAGTSKSGLQQPAE